MAGAVACGRQPDTAAAVVTPSVTLARSDVAVGSPVDVTYRFVVAPGASFTEDYWVFVHFLDTDRELMWTDDHQPSVATRGWKPGQTIEYTRTMFVPKFPYVGEASVELGLYSPTTGERIPMTGENQGQRSYRLATFNLRMQSENLFVVFRDGWHETEVSGEGVGLEWQWSRQVGTIAFRNPMRDARFFLQVDQPVSAIKSQHVEVRSGDIVVDEFELAPGPRVLRTVDITKDQFGENETVEISISVDKTFVPALMPELKSSDSRELGIRVFRAFVQPR